MVYQHIRSKPFTAPLFIRENGYWENHMLPCLEAEGWAVITIDCAGVVSYLDFARRLVKTIDSTTVFLKVLICVGLLKRHV